MGFNMFRGLGAVMFALATLLLAMPVMAGGGDGGTKSLSPEQSVRQLVLQLKTINTIESEFEQRLEDSSKKPLQQLTGTMWVKRPGHFRWDTSEPFPQQIITDGKKIWVYDQDLEQVVEQEMDMKLGNTPALLLSGDPDKLSESFEISAARYTASGKWRYDLSPKGENNLFVSLQMEFLNDEVLSMVLQDGLGQTTYIAFKNPKVNGAINPSIFEFKVPPGVDVIRDL